MRSILGMMVCMALVAAPAAQAEELQLVSPGGGVQLSVSADGSGAPTYRIAYLGQSVIGSSALGLELTGGRLAEGLTVAGSKRRTVDRSYDLVAGKVSRARDHFNELTVDLAAPAGSASPDTPRHLQLVFRAYDDGVAFRYRLPASPSRSAVEIRAERTRFVFPRDYRCWGFNVGRHRSSFEGEYDPIPASQIREHNLYDAPLVCQTGEASTTFAIADADVKDYPGMYLAGDGAGGIGVQARLSPRLDDPDIAVRGRIGAELVSPWRLVMLAEKPGRLNESNLITSLNPEPAFDPSWVKPGKAAWDWWNGPVLKGVPKAGMNDATMKGFIDFAAENRLEYMLIDAGWYPGSDQVTPARPGADATRSIPEIDVPALVEYGRRKGVGIWLWVHWTHMDAQMDEALALYQRWGMKGIKVDFMDRDDQEMVNWYHRLLAKAAEHRLLVDLHGAYAPTGLARTYPNYLTQEGVLGAEYNKWSARITSRHNVTLAFTRLLLGPMDYTPGGFANVTPAEFKPNNAPPMVMTTRAHGLAMYVVYESPFACVADSPDVYRASPAGLEVIRDVPVTWDEIRVLSGEIGEHIVVARRKGREWWIGAMNNENAREVEFDLTPLALSGDYRATVWSDGARPTELVSESRRVSLDTEDTLRLKLAANGGGVVRLTPAR
jgi:alpha-glucosidase